MSCEPAMSADARMAGNLDWIEPDRKAMPRAFFTGMDWFPDCRDGGLDRYFHGALTAFAEAGMKGAALVSAAEETSLGGITVQGMAGPGALLWRRWDGARAIAREGFKQGVDVVNAHFALYAFPWLRDLPPHIPLVVNFHGPWAGEMRAEARSLRRRIVASGAHWIERTVYRRADRCITLSTAFRDLLHTRYRVPLERIRVVPGASDLTPYLQAPDRSAARAQLGWSQERRILLSVRRLARRMGLDLLIEAMAEVRKEFPEVLLLIGGKGPESENLKAEIGKRKLEGNVRLLGFIPEADLPAAYAAADFSVVPTVALEGFGLITVESLASGTPVLGTRVGATPEILEPLCPELLFAEATAQAMAEKIKAVLRGSVRVPGREECRAYSERFGWPKVVPQLLAVFEEAIAEKKAVR